MKFLAILKDSLRETIDSKIFYVMMGLSVLVTLIVLSVKFRQVPPEEQFKRTASQMTGMMSWALKGESPTYEITDFQQTNGASEPWEGNYRFIYVEDFPGEKPMEEFKQMGLVLGEKELKNQLRNQFGDWIDQIEVKEIKSDNPRHLRFEVATTGTKVKDRRGWRYEPSLGFGALPLSFLQGPLAGLVELIVDDAIGSFGAAVTMLIGIILTSFFIPNMLRKGTVDLLLAKPMHRVTLLIFKFVGGLTFMFLNTVVIMVGIWLAVGIRTDLWVNGLLLCVFVFTFQFAIFYAVSTLMAVLTRSAIVAILVCVVTWGILWVVGMGYRFLELVRPENVKDTPQARTIDLPKWVFVGGDILHFVTPHYKDLDVLTTKLIRSDLMDASNPARKEIEKRLGSINWAESLVVTCVFIGVMLGLSCLWFATRDY
jgi:ABC-type transport system involved in multi-copper enzyme maturation permease subunit